MPETNVDQKEKIKAFEKACRPLIKYLAENHHPHMIALVTSSSASLNEGVMATGDILDYIGD